jgi:hypothetical protein
MPANLVAEGREEPVVFALRKVEVLRIRGIVLITLYTTCAIFIIAPGCVLVFRQESLNVMTAGQNYEVDLV